MWRLATIPFSLTLLVILSMIWASGQGDRRRADFSFVNRGENKSLDPNNMSWMQDIRLAYGLWEGLYTLDSDTLKPILGTADHAEVDPQTHTVWTLHIRTGARWSNGDPVTADDFLFAWRRFLETPGEYTYLHYYIRGARAYSDAFAKFVEAHHAGARSTSATQPAMSNVERPSFATVGEEKLDDHTLRVTLEDPIPFFPALCAFPPFFPLHEPSMRAFGKTDPATGVTHYDAAFTRPPHLVSNGSYEMTEWTFKRRVRLEASKYYWDRAHVLSPIIDQVYAEDGLAAFRAFERGDVDWLSDVDSDTAANLLTKGGNKDLHVFPAFGTYFYSLNCLPKLPDGRPNPMADVRVRQALAMAIDKEPIVRNVGRLDQPIATTYIPPGVFDGFPPPKGLPFDVTQAKMLLADAGFPDGKGFPHLRILYNNESLHGDVALVIRHQWLANLGIEMDLDGVEIKVFGSRLHSQQYDVARASWYGDYDDPSTFTDKYKSDSDDNDSKWNNPQYDKLCAQAQKETDPTRRLALLSQAEQILLTEAPIIPLYTYVNSYMFRPSVTGIPLSPQAMAMFKSIKVHDGPTH